MLQKIKIEGFLYIFLNQDTKTKQKCELQTHTCNMIATLDLIVYHKLNKKKNLFNFFFGVYLIKIYDCKLHNTQFFVVAFDFI